MNHDTPVSLYIVTQPNDKAGLLADTMDFKKSKDGTTTLKPSYKHHLLCMIDEFPSLGKLEILPESLAFLAGYSLKFYLICKGINQPKKLRNGLWPR